jgi:hypothetical protein
MRRYLVTKRCLHCGKELPLEEAVLTYRTRSVVVSVCSLACREALQLSLGAGKERRKFATLVANPV